MPKNPANLTIGRNGQTVELEIRPSERARRMQLKVPIDRRIPVLTVPVHYSPQLAESFALDNIDWLVRCLSERPATTEFLPGQVIPLRGDAHRTIAAFQDQGRFPSVQA